MCDSNVASNIVNHRHDFVLVISAQNTAPNTDPSTGMPRTTADGYGWISDVAIKRKIRNRLQDEGEKILYQSEERAGYDGQASIEGRIEAIKKDKSNSGADAIRDAVLEEYIDSRLFGATIAYKGKQSKKSKSDEKDNDKANTKTDGVSIGIRGSVSINQAFSVDPVHVMDMQISKSVNGQTVLDENGNVISKKSSDTLGHKYMVEFGVYVICGSVNAYNTDITKMTEDDVEKLKMALSTLFVNDASAARPAGSLTVEKMYWWEHNCKVGQYSEKQVYRSVKVDKRDGIGCPMSIDDYDIHVDNSYQRDTNRLEVQEII